MCEITHWFPHPSSSYRRLDWGHYETCQSAHLNQQSSTPVTSLSSPARSAMPVRISAICQPGTQSLPGFVVPRPDLSVVFLTDFVALSCPDKLPFLKSLSAPCRLSYGWVSYILTSKEEGQKLWLSPTHLWRSHLKLKGRYKMKKSRWFLTGRRVPVPGLFRAIWKKLAMRNLHCIQQKKNEPLAKSSTRARTAIKWMRLTREETC